MNRRRRRCGLMIVAGKHMHNNHRCSTHALHRCHVLRRGAARRRRAPPRVAAARREPTSEDYCSYCCYAGIMAALCVSIVSSCPRLCLHPLISACQVVDYCTCVDLPWSSVRICVYTDPFLFLPSIHFHVHVCLSAIVYAYVCSPAHLCQRYRAAGWWQRCLDHFILS